MFFLKYPSLSISLRTLHAVGATPPTLSLTNCSIHNLHDFIILQSYLFLLNLNTNWVATEPQAICCYEKDVLQLSVDCRQQQIVSASDFMNADCKGGYRLGHSCLLSPLHYCEGHVQLFASTMSAVYFLQN